jgi:hypothetical protein
MEPERPLRDVFADLAGHDDGGQAAADPRAFLAEHEGLPDDLLVTAIGSYAGTAPAEVAEHLAPVVAASLPDPGEPGHAVGADAVGSLNLLVSAPVGEWQGEVPLTPDEPDSFHDQIPDDGAPWSDLHELSNHGLSNADSLDGDRADTGLGEHHVSFADALDQHDVNDGHDQFGQHGSGAEQVDGHDAGIDFDHFGSEGLDSDLDSHDDAGIHTTLDDGHDGGDFQVEHHLDPNDLDSHDLGLQDDSAEDGHGGDDAGHHDGFDHLG